MSEGNDLNEGQESKMPETPSTGDSQAKLGYYTFKELYKTKPAGMKDAPWARSYGCTPGEVSRWKQQHGMSEPRWPKSKATSATPSPVVPVVDSKLMDELQEYKDGCQTLSEKIDYLEGYVIELQTENAKQELHIAKLNDWIVKHMMDN